MIEWFGVAVAEGLKQEVVKAQGKVAWKKVTMTGRVVEVRAGRAGMAGLVVAQKVG